MTNIMGAPDRYIQGSGEVDRLHEYGSRLGNEFLVMAEEQTMANMRGLVEQALGDGHARHEEEED
jgi:glycerol dehydrogenase-like iron-containing ADH family enzyme